MGPAARLLLLLAAVALAVGGALELAGMEGRTAALAIATAALTGVCCVAAAAGPGPEPVADDGEPAA
jgi:hypothetical protein